MTMTVIVPLDGSPSAERELPIAATLARRSGGSVVLFTARDSGVPVDVDGYLAQQESRFGVVAEHQISEHRDIPVSLAKIAETHDDPVIVMSSRGPNGINEVVIGSITADTLRLTDAPVLLLGPHVKIVPSPTDPPYETLIVCLDGSHGAESILPIAQRWAKLLGLTIWIVQVVDPSVKLRVEGLAHEAVDESGYVHRVARKLSSAESETEFDVLHEDAHHPARALVRFAEGLPRPIIAMTTHGHTGLRGLVAGDVTMNVVRHATCPVLVVRPHDPAGNEHTSDRKHALA